MQWGVMMTEIIYKCQKHYHVNAEKIVKGITNKIPEKYLIGLDEIYLLDDDESSYPVCKYVSNNEGIRIEVYLENPILSKIPFISALSLNTYVLLAINKHIDSYLKPRTKDQEILSINSNKINYAWMSFSQWNPLFIIIRILNVLIAPTRLFRAILEKWNNYIEKRM